MIKVNRKIENPDLDRVDHALGRPFDPFDSYRDHYAAHPNDAAKFAKSPWWRRGKAYPNELVFFHVTKEGRQALADELKNNAEKYGRLFCVTYINEGGGWYVFAKSRSAAKYKAWLDADTEIPFIEYATIISARLARPQP